METSELSILSESSAFNTGERQRADPHAAMFREIQSSVFNDTLLPEFRAFWDANPTMHTSIESSERATDGELVMTCNQFLKEYYDFGWAEEEDIELVLPDPLIASESQRASWRNIISTLCSSNT